MWPNNRQYVPPMAWHGTTSQSQSRPAMSSSAATTSNLMSTATSLRNLFGDTMSQNMFQTMSVNSTATRPEPSLPQMTSRRPPDRHVIDYENPNYSRLDRSLMSQMSTSGQTYSVSPPMMTEPRMYDPTKLPQKSILKKSKDQSYEPPVISLEDEDQFLYGDAPTNASAVSSNLPPGIQLLDRSNSTPPTERPLSPISMRLKREMENMQNKSRRTPEHQEMQHWTPSLGMSSAPNPDVGPKLRNDWVDEEREDDIIMYRRRYRDAMNPSPEPEQSLELEKVRIQQMAAIQAGILQQSEKSTKRRESPDSPHRHYMRLSPESSPKRMRRWSRTPSPHRRRSISPRKRSRSPRRRSRSPRRRTPSPRRRTPSPRRRSISPRYRRAHRTRSRSRSRSREGYRRSRTRSRSPKRHRSVEQTTLDSMSRPIIPMPAQGIPYPSFPRPLVSGPMGSLIIPSMIPNPYPPYVSPSIQTSAGHKSQSPKKSSDKKEDKLINPNDLLLAEKIKLKSELEDLKRQYYRKLEDQELIIKRDNGSKESFAYKSLDRVVVDIRHSMEVTQKKLVNNIELTKEIQGSKVKAKHVMELLKETGDISKVTLEQLKKKELPKKPKPLPQKSKSPTKDVTKSNDKKEATVESEDEEKNSRFHYFDSGPHWCKPCDKFIDNMKNYFEHIHSKDHLSKHKESERTPWITTEYLREAERQAIKGKDQLMIASKGIQFILPTQGFYCQLCKEFLVDGYRAQKHFRSAKHNRSYTRYTLQNSDYEHKWKVERDKAFTEHKKKEREVEREKSKLEAQKKTEDRKRLEEEIKRKDREVKDRIEAMNKTQKSVKELDDNRAEAKSADKKEDKSKSSPKSNIRLNLSSKSESSDKSANKSKKLKTKESVDNTEDIVVDEIICEESNKDSEELKDNNEENISKSDQKSDTNDENVITIMDTSDEQEKSELVVNQTEKIDPNEGTVEEVEGVMPLIDTNPNNETQNSKNQINDEKLKESNISEDNRKEETNHGSEDIINKTFEEIVTEVGTETHETNEKDHKIEDNEPKEVENLIVKTQVFDCQMIAKSEDNCLKTYAEVVANGINQTDKPTEEKTCSAIESSNTEELKIGSDATVEPKVEVLDQKPVIKAEQKDFMDDDILEFQQRLKNLDSMVEMQKKESIDPEEEDLLDGFDVIDETK